MKQNRRLSRILAVGMVSLLMAACAGSTPESPDFGAGPPDAVATTQPPTRSSSVGPSQAAPKSPWSETAETTCRLVYDGRGRPPRAQSGDVDDDMALAEQWRGNLAYRAANGLADIQGPPDGAVSLVTALISYSNLSVQMAGVYLEGGYQPSKLNAIESKREQAASEVRLAARLLGTPSCALIAEVEE